MKRIISIILTLVISLSMFSFGSVIASADEVNYREIVSGLFDLLEKALYVNISEQSRKLLNDRLERVKAVMADEQSSDDELYEAFNVINQTVIKLQPMNAVEIVPVNGFSLWNDDDLRAMSGSVGEIRFNTDVKPEDSDRSVSVTPVDGGAVFCNYTADGVVGASPFGMDMLKADGIRFWVSSESAAKITVEIGKITDTDGLSKFISYKSNSISVKSDRYLYLPFDTFSSDSDVRIPKDGSLNCLRISAEATDTLYIADFSAYNEIIEEKNDTQYTETLIKARSEVGENDYFKIIESSSGKAVTSGFENSEVMEVWEGDIPVSGTSNEITLTENVEGDLSQMWQFSPTKHNTFRIINKATGCALTATSGVAVAGTIVTPTNSSQEWSISATGGNFSMQVKGVGKLTTAGDTVKVTNSSTTKKFKLYRITDKEYIETWCDDFDGDKIDRSNWNVMDGYYFGGNISSIHLDDEEKIEVKDGIMKMKAVPEQYGGASSQALYMSTSGKYAIGYGKVEVRAKLAYGDGQFPAFWLMPAEKMNMGGGEVDIMEMVVEGNIKTNGEQIGTIHWTSDGTLAGYYSKVNHMVLADGELLSDAYHTYAVEMDHDQVRYYFDGMQYMALNINIDGKDFAFGDNPRFILINNSLKGDGNFNIDPKFNMEKEYVTEIDYVKCSVREDEITGYYPDLSSDGDIQYSTPISGVTTNDYYEKNNPVALKTDGSEGAFVDNFGHTFIFNPVTNETVKCIHNSNKAAKLLKYSPDGTKLVFCSNIGVIQIYDTSDYDKAPVTICNGATAQENMQFTSDSAYIIVGGFNGGFGAYQNPIDSSIAKKGYVRVFDTATGALFRELYTVSDPRDIKMSADGTMFAVPTTSNGIFVYNTSDWSEYAHLTGSHKYAIRSVSFSPDGDRLVSSDERGNIFIWDLAEKQAIKKMNNVNSGSVSEILFSPDGCKVLANSSYGAARLFDAESGELISLLGGFSALIRHIAYTPDGKHIVVTSYDKTMKVFEADGTYIETLKQDKAEYQGYAVSDIVFSPDSSYVFCATHTHPVSVHKWRLPKEENKDLLREAIANSALSEDKLAFAKSVLNLKYATPKLLYKAYTSILPPLMVIYNTANVSKDAMSYQPSAEVMKNEYFYFKGVTSASYDNCRVVITNTDTNELQNVEITKDNLISAESTGKYHGFIRILKLSIPNAGEYTVGLVDNRTDHVFAKAAVTVNENEKSNDFLYEIKDGEVKILAYLSGEKDIYIPDYIEGYPVTSIGERAFFSFGLAVGHMTVRLPSMLKTIEKSAFENCNSLRKVNLPDGLETIGEQAFYACRILNDLTIPDSVTKIGTKAFNFCSCMDYAVLGNGIKNYSTYMMLSNHTRTLIISDGVLQINGNVMGDQFVFERIYIPRSVTYIGTLLGYCQTKGIKVYGYRGTYAETFANSNKTRYTFVEIGNPVISGVNEGDEYDIASDEMPTVSWEDGHLGLLNGEKIYSGTKIEKPGQYTLKVINGYDEFTSEVHFTVVDSTPEPLVEGIEDGAEYDLYDGEPVSVTWTPAEATATLNGTAYTAGTDITEPGEYKLVVTNGTKTTEINFTVKDTSTVPVISGVEEGREYDLYAGEKPSATWDAGEATLNGEPYVAGTAIEAVGDYTLRVTNGTKSAEVSFSVVDSTPSYTLGDFDNDGQITVADALAALRIGAKLVEETPEAIAIGDVDNDGHVTVADALAILRVAAKLVDHL